MTLDEHLLFLLSTVISPFIESQHLIFKWSIAKCIMGIEDEIKSVVPFKYNNRVGNHWASWRYKEWPVL